MHCVPQKRDKVEDEWVAHWHHVLVTVNFSDVITYPRLFYRYILYMYDTFVQSRLYFKNPHFLNSARFLVWRSLNKQPLAWRREQTVCTNVLKIADGCYLSILFIHMPMLDVETTYEHIWTHLNTNIANITIATHHIHHIFNILKYDFQWKAFYFIPFNTYSDIHTQFLNFCILLI